MAFKDNLKRLRKNNYSGTIKDFAEKVLRIPYTTYYGYENRDTLPPEQLILKISTVLGVSIDELFGYRNKYRDIEQTIKTLNRLGLKTQWNKKEHNVCLYANDTNIIGNIPEDVFMDIVLTSHQQVTLKYDKMFEDIMYAMIVRAVIFYTQNGLDDGSKEYEKKRKTARVTVNLSPIESSEVL